MRYEAFIFVSERVIWPSHEQVKVNLTRCYLNAKRAGLTVKKMSIPDDLSFKTELTRLIAQSHQREGQLHLVMLDIGLNLTLLSQLAPFMHKERVTIHLHLHGDFILRLAEWQELLRKLQGFRVGVRVCSQAMKDLCQEYFPELSLMVIAFPIADVFFKAAPLAPRKAIISYFGRLTADKGLLHLLQWWDGFKQREEFELHLYGEWDANTHLSWLSRSDFTEAYHQVQDLLARHPQIKLQHLKSTSALRRAMDRSQVIISLSTFKAEEYGLALREAAARGKPLVLTKWGGHKDLASLPQVKFLPVTKDLSVDLKKIKVTELTTTRSQQQQSARLFSMKSVTQMIKKSWDQTHRLKPLRESPSLAMDDAVKKHFR